MLCSKGVGRMPAGPLSSTASWTPLRWPQRGDHRRCCPQTIAPCRSWYVGPAGPPLPTETGALILVLRTLTGDGTLDHAQAYFMTQQPTMALVAQPTFCLRLARLHLAFVGGVVPLRHALRAINGTVVGLVASTTACVTSFDVIRDAPIAECVGQGAYLVGWLAPRKPAGEQEAGCRGVTACQPPSLTVTRRFPGVVRAVDVDAGLIYIIAPESEARLERVNILVRVRR